MPPRGRSKKVGLKRIDAAIDAFGQMGYKREVIVKTIKELLEVYGGDEGWPFIEMDSYRAVMEKLLEDEENERKQIEDARSIRALEGPSGTRSGDRNSPPPRRRRPPCYGYISETESSESDEGEVGLLTPIASPQATPKKRKSRWDIISYE